MSDEHTTSRRGPDPPPPAAPKGWRAPGSADGRGVSPPPRRPTRTAGGDGAGGGARRHRHHPRIYRLRIALIVAGLAVLALLSTVFGMLMAVAQELPALENRQEYRSARNSVLYDDTGRQLAILTGNKNRVLVGPAQIAPAMQHAVIAIEDQRFYKHNGIDVRGIARALWADVAHRKAVQGASTIPQQFVKNALATQRKRTIFEKLREAALAYHLTRKWSKEKILTEYLNSIYFGNGAYGVESAARVYFGFDHPGCGQEGEPNCASLLSPAESALLAGMVASPAAWDPAAHPLAARRRRDLVLKKMLQQGYLGRADYEQARAQPLPTAATIQPPSLDSKSPYFTSWVQAQVVERFGAAKAFAGGLKIRTTLDLDLQRTAEQAVGDHLSDPGGPAATLVAIDNATGAVRAMVGGRPGRHYSASPFNLATQGQRQPGSSFKAFVLAAALRAGISPDSEWTSQQKIFTVPHSAGRERFVVHNFEGDYVGVRTLSDATANSDNSVFAEVGIKVGTSKIARLAEQMGIRTPISHNYAITLGGLREGVTTLDMAHAYETLAEGGQRVTGTLGASDNGPVGIEQVVDPLGRRTIDNQPIRIKVVSHKLADTETELLTGVVCCGTGKEAATGAFAAGKTGTTENYGDAWFIGYTKRWTVAVWVGYPDAVKSMRYDFGGQPVIGGSYPAEIWHEFVVAADQITDQRLADKAAAEGRTYTPPAGSSAAGAGSASGASGAGGAGTGAAPGGGASRSGRAGAANGAGGGSASSGSGAGGGGSGSGVGASGGGNGSAGSGVGPGASGGGGGSGGAGANGGAAAPPSG
jgi:penicillin-binding protein 1A